MMTIDLFVFLTSFRVSVPQGIIMATRLLQRADKEAPDAVRGAQENLRRVCAKIDGEYTARGTRRKQPKIRDSVAAMANAWRAIQMRVEAWTMMPGEPSDESIEAQGLIDAVHTRGLAFLVGDPAEQWIESRRRLAILTSAEHQDAVHRLIGAPFIASLRKAHLDAGVVLGLIGEADTSDHDEQNYRPLVKELVDAIRDYALQVIAADKASGASDPAHVARLLEPIETQRSRQSSDSSGDDEEQDDPVPAPAPAPQPDVVRDARPANDAAQPAAGERRVA